MFYLEFITSFKEVNCFQFFLHGSFFFIGHILERSAVLTQIQPNQFHNAFATDNIAAIMADNIDYFLCKVLTFAGQFQVSGFPCFNDAYQFFTVIIGCSTDTTV